jgi:hypothetical protein
MGRSVSYAPGSVEICFRDVSNFGYRDEEGEPTDKYDGFLAQDEWDWFTEGIIIDAQKQWPSLLPVECHWLGNKDRVLVENSHCYIGVSEYGGLASIWLVPRTEGSDWSYEDTSGLALNWCSKIGPKFKELFGELEKVGTFSNGEAVYRKTERTNK